MSAERFFVSDRGAFNEIMALASRVFVPTTLDLPAPVFVPRLPRYRFVEFDRIISTPFFSLVQALALAGGDESVYFLMLDPDPDDYYFKYFGRFGLLHMKPTDDPEEYSSALVAEPPDSPADAMMYVSSKVAWVGSSTRWAILGERYLGVGVVAIEQGFSWPEGQRVRWYDTKGALSNLIAPNFENEVIPDELRKAIAQNYPADF